MERQLANLTGLVQKALTQTPAPREYLQVPPPASARDANYRNGTYAMCVRLFHIYPLCISKYTAAFSEVLVEGVKYVGLWAGAW